MLKVNKMKSREPSRKVYATCVCVCVRACVRVFFPHFMEVLLLCSCVAVTCLMLTQSSCAWLWIWLYKEKATKYTWFLFWAMFVAWLVGAWSLDSIVLQQVLILFQSGFSTKCESSATLFKLQYLLFSLRSSSKCLQILPVFLSLLSFLQYCFRRLFLYKLWSIQLAFLYYVTYYVPLFPCTL